MINDELFNQANALHHDHQLSAAIELYEQVLKANPKHSPSLHFLGLAQAQLGQAERAIGYLNKALSFDPNNAVIYNNLANVYKQLAQLKEAALTYQKALSLDPNYAQAHHNLANVYAMQDLYQQALSHYHAALQIAPDFAPAHFNLGLLFLKQAKLDAARIQFQNVVTLNPKHIDAQFYLGVLALEANDLDPAKAAFLAVLKENNNHIEALTNLGVIAVKTEEGQAAIDYFSKALALDNNHLEARNNLAATFIHHDRFENALMHYDYLLQKDPNNIEYLYNSGVAQMALGHLNEAINHFEHLLSQEGKHFAALNNLAAIYIRLKEKDKAKHLLQQAINVNPLDKASQHMLNALSGHIQSAETSPEYALNLFNNYALYYDQHVQNYLKYALPNQILTLLSELDITAVDITLDLGCGTGLTGQVLRDLTKTLIGVDLAKKMLELARNKGIYDQLIESEALEYLHTTQQTYDLIVAADVLPYFGDLSPLFVEISHHLKAKGYFVFTTEISVTLPWQLQASARFSHHEHYLEELSEANAMQLVAKKQIIARHQDGQPLYVLLIALQKH